MLILDRNLKRRVCFVTGTRAEFGLMATALRAIAGHPQLTLQIIATGMHLDPAHGDGVRALRAQGWKVDATVPWPSASGRNQTRHAKHTGLAMASLAEAFERLASDIVLVVGDRVEAFAAAAAAHLAQRIVAHVHGGDRAAGQVDDALRHAITKLAHLHFPATAQSAARLVKMGEDRWRIRRVGSPGVDGIRAAAMSWPQLQVEFPTIQPRRFALLVLHPVDSDEALEAKRARQLLSAVQSRFEQVVVIHPNNDPGAAGIQHVWEGLNTEQVIVRRDVARAVFLGLMRDAGVLVGNSSSGIIEAASFGTPVVDVGTRQQGRECGTNVQHVPYGRSTVATALKRLWDGNRWVRVMGANEYGGGGAGTRIADALAKVRIDARLRRKLIAY